MDPEKRSVGRPRTGRFKTIVSFDRELLPLIDKAAAGEGLNRSEFIEALIRRTLVTKEAVFPKKLIRKRHLAEMISISTRSIDGLMKARVIPFVKFRGTVLFDIEAVIAALKDFERKTLKK